MIKINIILNNKNWYRYIKNPGNFVEEKVANLSKRLSKYKKNIIFFTLLLSGDKEIKRLNKKFRNKNKSTDVLSFPFYNKRDFKNIQRKEKEIYLGDIIININKINNKKFNVGGGRTSYTSLRDLTKICQRLTGNKVKTSSIKKTSIYDIPYYISDNTKIKRTYKWIPKNNVFDIVTDTYNWLNENKKDLKKYL
jgi:ssRNA-specific RNase YbeY (16S rRNA maturation enzyme)